MSKIKLQKILSNLSNLDSGLPEAFKSIEKEMQRVANKLREEAEIKTVENAKKRITELKEEIKMAVETLLNSFDDLRKKLEENEKSLVNVLENKLAVLNSSMLESKTANSERAKILANEISNLRIEIKELSEHKIKMPDFASEIKKVELELNGMLANLKEESGGFLKEQTNDFQKKIDKINDDIIELRKKTMSMLSSFRGGGNANRNIAVNGNTSVLSRYTDINIIAGSIMGIATANDDIVKQLNLTISGIPSSIASAVVAGNNTEIQYNNSGTFGTSSTLTWNRNTSVLGATNIQVPSFTQGSVPFQLSTSVLGQDNANLFWDDANNRLGIDTSTPGAPLDVLVESGEAIRITSTSFARINKQGNGNLEILTSNAGANILLRPGSSTVITVQEAGHVLLTPANNVGIGTTSPDRLLHSELSDGTTDAVTYPQRLTHITTGTPADNIGVGLEFEAETAANNNEILGTEAVVAVDTTATSEDGKFQWQLMTAGAAATTKLELYNAPWMVLDEADADPTTTQLDSLDSGAFYFKNNKLVFAYNNAGTITYISIPLDGATTAWTHGTTAP